MTRVPMAMNLNSKICLPVCLPVCLSVCLSVTSLIFPLLKLRLVQNNNCIYTCSIDKLFVKAYTCYKSCALSSKQHPVKGPIAHAHLSPSVGPYSIDIFGSLIGTWGFVQFTIIKKHNTIFVLFQKSVFKCACAANKE